MAEQQPIRRTMHGKRRTPEYRAWCHIIGRCCNPNNHGYKHYGGRGIKVCDRWRYDFLAFLTDMGLRPSPGHSIDRFPDPNGHYEPGNCRWATRIEQARNTTVNRVIEFNGERRCLSEWAEIVGINLYTLHARLNKRGWTVERTLTVRPRPGGNYQHLGDG